MTLIVVQNIYEKLSFDICETGESIESIIDELNYIISESGNRISKSKLRKIINKSRYYMDLLLSHVNTLNKDPKNRIYKNYSLNKALDIIMLLILQELKSLYLLEGATKLILRVKLM